MESNKRRGTIVTFYSYKGGTGRSMALANAAWILAANGRRVLTIDWDLEAPGLHRYFRPFLIDAELSDTVGLIDFFWTYSTQAMTPQGDEHDDVWWQKVTDLGAYTIQLDWEFPESGCVDLICSGRQDSGYADLVNSFNWSNFYRRLDGALLLRHVRERLKADYDYILIDSRTGVSDTSGICTVAMPDSLVAMFTLNRQSVDGVAAVLESIKPQRAASGLRIFPVVARVELGEKERLDAARERTRPKFNKYVIEDGSVDVQRYWGDMEIMYQPYYAYEEILAAFGDPTGQGRSDTALLAGMERLVQRFTGDTDIMMPVVAEAQRRTVLGQFAGTERNDGPAAVDSTGEEDRRVRANHYLEKDLGQPAERAEMRGRRAEWGSRMTAVFVIAGGLLNPFLIMVGYPRLVGFSELIQGPEFRVYLMAAMTFGGLMALSKVLGMTSRARPPRHRYFELTTLVLALAMCGMPIWGLQVATRGVPVDIYFSSLSAVVLPALLPALAQGVSLVVGFDTKAALGKSIAERIKQETRRYVHLVSPYSSEEGLGEQAAWKLFIERLEEALAEEKLEQAKDEKSRG